MPALPLSRHSAVAVAVALLLAAKGSEGQDLPAATVASQGGSSPGFVTPLLAGSEAEHVFCTERRVDRDQVIQRRGDGWYSPSWDEAFPATWEVTLLESGRTVTLNAAPYRRPRQIVVISTRPDSLGGGLETVQVLFRGDGSVQDGSRAVTSRARVQRGPLLEEDGILAFTLARELAFRCQRGFYDAMGPNTLWGIIPQD